jgi:hypothetical protein
MLAANDYFKSVRRSYPPLLWSLFIMGDSNPQVFEGILKKPFAWKNMAVIDYYRYFSKKDFESLKKNVFESWSDPKHFQKAKKIISGRERTLLDSAHQNFESFSKAYCCVTPLMSPPLFVWF